MGQRANLVLVKNGCYRLFYSHWCANTLPRDLFWGPEHAVKFIQIQREMDKSDWLDEVWAEGAAVVDLDKRVLLLFGGEDICFDIPLRRVYLESLARIWNTWTVNWAHEGIASVADYVGFPRASVLGSRKEPPVCSLVPLEGYLPDTVASIRWSAEQLSFYPLADDPDVYLLSGVSLLKADGADRGVAEFLMNELDEGRESFPTGGFHIDVPARTVDFWTARSRASVASEVAELWPDWSVRWHRDSFEVQVDCASGRLRFPPRSPNLLKRQLAEMLLCDFASNGPRTVMEMANHDCHPGATVEINPLALRDDRLEIPMNVRRKIVESVVRPTSDIGDKRNALFSMFAKLARFFSRRSNTV